MIINRGSMPRKRTGRKWCNSSRPQCARHSRLRAHWLMALVGGGGGAEGEVCILRSPGNAASPISLLSMGGVCGRSLIGRENFLHWKANMLPLFSIMALLWVVGACVFQPLLLEKNCPKYYIFRRIFMCYLYWHFYLLSTFIWINKVYFLSVICYMLFLFVMLFLLCIPVIRGGI